MDSFFLGPYKYTVLKRDGRRWLVSWIEASGIQKELWLIVKQDLKTDLAKAA